MAGMTASVGRQQAGAAAAGKQGVYSATRRLAEGPGRRLSAPSAPLSECDPA
jgi:hypothetical protein